MKRWLAMVMVLALVLCAGAGAVPARAAEAERWTVDPLSLPEDLTIFLDCFCWFEMFGGSYYDASAIGEDCHIMGGVFELCTLYDLYPGDSVEEMVSSNPRGRWDGWCYAYDGEKTDWILQHIFNYTPEDIAWTRVWGEDPERDYYYEDGTYYVWMGGVGGGFSVYPAYVETDGEYYYITFIVYAGDGYIALDGLEYAVVSLKELDGQSWWSLHYWSRELPPSEGHVLGDLSGSWTLAGDYDSGLSIDTAPDATARIDAWFYRMASFTADGVNMPDGKTAVFTDTDPDVGFSGWLTKEGDRISLHVIPLPVWGEDPWGGFFDGTFDYHRSGNAAVAADTEAATPAESAGADAAFSITPEEIEREIEEIRSAYYTPTDADERVTLQNGTDGWNYSRDYTFHNGQLVFAFIFDGTEEHRLYFKDDHMIRYIDEYHTVFDFGELDRFSDWAERALAEAYTLRPRPTAPAETVEALDVPEAWLGTWGMDNGETLEVIEATDKGITLIYNGWTEEGSSMFHSVYILPYTDGSRLVAAETAETVAAHGWGYTFTLAGDHIVMSSRYPDRSYYRQ